jgi:hypothetical protein
VATREEQHDCFHANPSDDEKAKNKNGALLSSWREKHGRRKWFGK